MSETGVINLVVSGAGGRMGTLLCRESEGLGLHLIGGLEHPEYPNLGQGCESNPNAPIQTDLNTFIGQTHLIIEFALPDAAIAHARIAAEHGVALLIGTTGFDEDQLAELKTLAQKTPILITPNMSLGIFTLRQCIQALSKTLSPFGITPQATLSETHHIHKKDAPSGTAKQLAQEVTAATGQIVPDDAIEAKREGEVPGIHHVTFAFGREKITLTHEAEDRVIFAVGALTVGRKLIEANLPAGLYSIDDILDE